MVCFSLVAENEEKKAVSMPAFINCLRLVVKGSLPLTRFVIVDTILFLFADRDYTVIQISLWIAYCNRNLMMKRQQ